MESAIILWVFRLVVCVGLVVLLMEVGERIFLAKRRREYDRETLRRIEELRERMRERRKAKEQ